MFVILFSGVQAKKQLGYLTMLSVSFLTAYTLRRSPVTLFFITDLSGCRSDHMISIFGSNVTIATSVKLE